MIALKNTNEMIILNLFKMIVTKSLSVSLVTKSTSELIMLCGKVYSLFYNVRELLNKERLFRIVESGERDIDINDSRGQAKALLLFSVINSVSILFFCLFKGDSMMVERRKKTFNIISKRFLESIIDDVSSIYVGVLDNSIDIYSLKAEIKFGLLYAFKAAGSKFKAYEIYSRIQACLISEEDSCILIKVNIDGDYPNSVKEYLLKYIQKCLYSLRVEYDGRISI